MGLDSGAFLDARLGLAVSSTTSCSLIVSSSSAGSDFADLEVRFVAAPAAVVSGCLAARALLEVFLGVGAASGITSSSLTGSGSLAARALLEVFLALGAGSGSLAGSGATSGSSTGSGSLAARALLEVLLGASLTSGSGAAFADLEVLLGVGAGAASLMASSTGSSTASGPC